ncbi:MAG: DNA-3-methyladenine glycosylase 2 family protein [Pseudomonadota bacterium]
MHPETIRDHILRQASAYHPLANILQARCIDIPPSTMPSAADYLTRAITGQQLSVKAASTIWGRVQAAAGTTPFADYFVPDNTEILRACGLSYSKIKAASAVQAFFREHALSDAHLAEMSASERAKMLCQIWGIGQWTCDMMSLFYFRDPDVWALGDGGLLRAVGIMTDTPKPTVTHMVDFAAPFAPYRGYLSLYLWRILDNAPDPSH